MTRNNNLGIGKIRLILLSVMGLVFFGLGAILLFTRIYSEDLSAPRRYYIGGVLVLWGFFRIFTAYRYYRSSLAEEEADDEA